MKAAVQLMIGFDDDHAVQRWVTTAMCRGLLPEITGVFRRDDGTLHVAEVCHGQGVSSYRSPGPPSVRCSKPRTSGPS